MSVGGKDGHGYEELNSFYLFDCKSRLKLTVLWIQTVTAASASEPAGRPLSFPFSDPFAIPPTWIAVGGGWEARDPARPPIVTALGVYRSLRI